MITSCYGCGYCYKSEETIPCPRCGSIGPYIVPRKLEDLDEPTEEITHQKIRDTH